MTVKPNTAIHRYHTAKGYLQSAIMIFRSPERQTRELVTLLSLCMLTGFALELYFKAYLLACGNQVRGYGHRVRTLYFDAMDAGLKAAFPTEGALALASLVETLGQGHEDFTFRYLEEGDNVTCPQDWERTFSVLNALDDVVDEKVGASAAYGLPPGRYQ